MHSALVKLVASENVPLTPSLDGKRIAYISAGKLWTVATTGGPPLAIADCEGAAVAWSPDGAWLVFRRTPTLVKVNSQGGGPAIEIPSTSGPVSPGLAWTNAGIYYRSGAKLVRVPLAGGEPVELADMAGSLEHASPDGRFLYSTKLAPRPALAVLDAATGLELRSIPIPTDGELRRLSVHPNGQRIAAEIADSHYNLWMMEGFPAPAVGWERLFWRWLERPAAR